MHRRLQHLNRGTSSRRDRRWVRSRSVLAASLALFAASIAFAWWRLGTRMAEHAPARLSAAPSEMLNAAVNERRRAFADRLTTSIRRRGYLAVTVHVGLADTASSRVPERFGDGEHPGTNLTWGALYGVDTHLPNSAGWDRVYGDDGGGGPILRRSVFRRPCQATAAWRARGVDRPFEIYLLANAWPHAHLRTAMVQPLRELLAGETTTIRIGQHEIGFGGAGDVAGYIGPNPMLTAYWDAFAGLPRRPSDGERGVFYACPRSAVVLHAACVDHGLYPLLFTRTSVPPEGYLVSGLMDALGAGVLDAGLLDAVAAAYVRHHSDVSPGLARSYFFR